MGVPMCRIKAQTGHLSNSMLERYLREGKSSSIDALKMISASVTGKLSSGLQQGGKPEGAQRSNKKRSRLRSGPPR